MMYEFIQSREPESSGEEGEEGEGIVPAARKVSLPSPLLLPCPGHTKSSPLALPWVCL